MAKHRMDVASFVGKLLEQDDVDTLREGVRILAQAVMETEVSSQIGAFPMSAARSAPPIATATARGPGTPGSAPSSALDSEVEAFRNRPIEEECPYVILDATFHKVRELDRVISVACVVALGITTSGERRVLGVDCGPSEDEAFWTRFLRGLIKRGLKGVRLVVSDGHEGLKAAIAKVLSGCQWQRCRVHFMRNLLSTVPRAAQETVAAFVRTIFYQPDHSSALSHLNEVAGMLEARFPEAAALLLEAAEDVLAHMHFPEEHRRRLHSTNTVERLHMEIKRRTRVVGIFPNRASLLRMVGTLLQEQDDEWQVAERRYFSAESMIKIDTELEGGDVSKELLAAIA